MSQILPSEIDESKFLEVKLMTPSVPGSASAGSEAAFGDPVPADTTHPWNNANMAKTDMKKVLNDFILSF